MEFTAFILVIYGQIMLHKHKVLIKKLIPTVKNYLNINIYI